MCKMHPRHKKLLWALDRIESGAPTGGIDTYWCAMTLGWLWQWRKISKNEMERLADRIYELTK